MCAIGDLTLLKLYIFATYFSLFDLHIKLSILNLGLSTGLKSTLALSITKILVNALLKTFKRKEPECFSMHLWLALNQKPWLTYTTDKLVLYYLITRIDDYIIIAPNHLAVEIQLKKWFILVQSNAWKFLNRIVINPFRSVLRSSTKPYLWK